MKSLLISVHPEFMQMYKTGKKIAEMRKTTPLQPFETVYIYNTGTGQIELKADCIEIKKTILSDLEQRYFKYVGIEPKSIKTFCNKKGEAYLLIFGYVSRLQNPIPYRKMTEAGIMPPQNYSYFNPEIFGYGNIN